MLKKETHLGEIKFSERFLTGMIANIVTGCFGVVGVCNCAVPKRIKNFFMLGKYTKKGIYLFSSGNKIEVEVHIMVMHGTNISAISESIKERIAYTIEESTGFETNKVVVCIDGMLD